MHPEIDTVSKGLIGNIEVTGGDRLDGEALIECPLPVTLVWIGPLDLCTEFSKLTVILETSRVSAVAGIRSLRT